MNSKVFLALTNSGYTNDKDPYELGVIALYEPLRHRSTHKHGSTENLFPWRTCWGKIF